MIFAPSSTIVSILTTPKESLNLLPEKKLSSLALSTPIILMSLGVLIFTISESLCANSFKPKGCASSFLLSTFSCCCEAIKIHSTKGSFASTVPRGTAKSAPIESASCLSIFAAPTCKSLMRMI